MPDGSVTVAALGLPGVLVSGATESAALNQMRLAIAELARKGYVTQVEATELRFTAATNPWLALNGVFHNDPDWEAFQSDLSQYRQIANEQTAATNNM